MFALLIVPILVSGFIMLTKIPMNYYKLHRYDGQFLYINSAYLGLCCLFWSVIGAFVIKLITFSSIPLVTWLSNFFKFSSDAESSRLISWILLLSIVSVSIPLLLAKLSRAGIKEMAKQNYELEKNKLKEMMEEQDACGTEVVLFDKEMEKKEIERHHLAMYLSILDGILPDGSLNKLLLRSLIDRELVLISMKNRKVYVGYVNKIGEPNEKHGPNSDISIVPVLSGYRDKDTLNVVFTNDYKELSGVHEERMSTIIPQSEVSQASFFSMDIHSAIDNNVESKGKENKKTLSKRFFPFLRK